MVLDGMLAARMFLPQARLEGSPERFDLPFEDVAIDSAGHILHGWLVRGSGTPWLWSHGNGGNISHRLEQAATLHGRFGMPMLLYDYRGYGRSAGRPTEEGTYEDSRAALSAMEDLIGCEAAEVICFGQSLGGAVATELAASLQMKALVLESTFTSVSDLIAGTWAKPFSSRFARVYDTASKIGSVRAPVLLMHGSRDEIVSPGMSRRLFHLAHPSKTFRVVAGAAHDDLHRSSDYTSMVAGFLASL